MAGIMGDNTSPGGRVDLVGSALGPTLAEELDAALQSTGTEWGSSRWDEAARCEVAYARRYEPQRFRLPIATATVTTDSADASRASADEQQDPSPQAQSALDKADAREVGSLLHAMIAWLADGELTGGIRNWRDVLTRASEQGDRWDPLSIAEARRLMGAYLSQWGESWNGTGLVVRAVELALQITDLDLPAPWTTRTDLVVEDREGRIWFVDHKSRGRSPSASDPEGAIRREARVRPQFLGTSWALREHLSLDYNPGVIVNVIVKTRMPAFFRVPVVLGSSQLAMWREAQTAFAQRRADGCTPIPNLRECIHPLWGECDWYGDCHGKGE